jgi:HAD superfamily hydrolase (TIGR01484 family)
MRYLALACDYDGTLAAHGRVAPETVAVLERLRASGRQLLLVTGRELDDLLAVFPHIHLFDSVVAKNGAVLYSPASQQTTLLSVPPKGVDANIRACVENGRGLPSYEMPDAIRR